MGALTNAALSSAVRRREGRTMSMALSETTDPSSMRAPNVSLSLIKEVSHATQVRSPRHRVLSRSQVNDARASRPRRASNAVFESCAAAKSLLRSLVAMIRAHACPAVDFKNCCMLSGEFDGSDRHHFFQGVRTSSNNALEWAVNGWQGRAVGAWKHVAPAALLGWHQPAA
jgi:hypothetical protein